MAITLRDVAARAGVSANTVSRALNKTGYVNRQTQLRIDAAVAELGYVPNAVASSLRSKKTQLFALLLTDITNPFWTTIARGVEDAAMEAGYAVILCNTDEDLAKEARYLDLLLRKRIDGMVIAPTVESTHILQNLERRDVPFVLIDRLVNSVVADSVRGDSKSGAYDMTTHLLSTGYRRIGMLGGPLTISTTEERVAGYTEALADAGIPADSHLVLYGHFTEGWGYQATLELMSRERRPDALFAANNTIALGVLEALRVMGLRVPQDVAVVCFDDTTQFSAGKFLTTAMQPAREIGRVAINLLLDRLADPKRDVQDIVLPTELVIRSSCGCNSAFEIGVAEVTRRSVRPGA
ncbi:MAG: LacI family DNA-binding transcriptional regulator [Chloroflexota bacterium]